MTLAIAYGESVEAAPYASLRDAIIGATARIPDGHFIHAKANPPHRTSTYRETLEMAAALAAGLGERGMRPGDGLIINLRNSEDFIPRFGRRPSPASSPCRWFTTLDGASAKRDAKGLLHSFERS